MIFERSRSLLSCLVHQPLLWCWPHHQHLALNQADVDVFCVVVRYPLRCPIGRRRRLSGRGVRLRRHRPRPVGRLRRNSNHRHHRTCSSPPVEPVMPSSPATHRYLRPISRRHAFSSSRRLGEARRRRLPARLQHRTCRTSCWNAKMSCRDELEMSKLTPNITRTADVDTMCTLSAHGRVAAR